MMETVRMNNVIAVVVTYNRLPQLRNCFKALQEQEFSQFDIVIVAFPPADVHAQQHLRPVAAFSSPCTRVDGQNDAQNVLLVAHHVTEFQFLDLLQRSFVARLHFRLRRLAFIEEIVGHNELVILLRSLLKVGNP